MAKAAFTLLLVLDLGCLRLVADAFARCRSQRRARFIWCARDLSRMAGSINLDSQRIRAPAFGSTKASEGGHIEEEGGEAWIVVRVYLPQGDNLARNLICKCLII